MGFMFYLLVLIAAVTSSISLLEVCTAYLIDKRIEKNKSQQIVAEEQARLDALIAIGALSFGRVYFAGYNKGTSDLIEGDFEFKFEVTTSPLMKSLSASISYTDIGLQTIFEGVK